MSLNKPEIMVDNQYGLVYNADTQSYKVLRIIPSSKIRGIEKMTEAVSLVEFRLNSFILFDFFQSYRMHRMIIRIQRKI